MPGGCDSDVLVVWHRDGVQRIVGRVGRLGVGGARARLAIAVLVSATFLAACSSDPRGGHDPNRTGQPVPRPTGSFVIGDGTALSVEDPSVRELRVEVLGRFPHDPGSYTQGLVEAPDGRLFESAGRYGSSDVREVDLATGAVRWRAPLDDEYFGEGLAWVDGELVQLTWKEGTAFVWVPGAGSPRSDLRYEGEGWGLCDDGDRMVMSDGSSRLTFRDRVSFEATGAVEVVMDGDPLERLNELECVDGVVWANVYQTDLIVVIDPSDGQVLARVDASGLLEPGERARADVLNGIAYRPGTDTFLLTGKLWPWMFEVRFVPV